MGLAAELMFIEEYVGKWEGSGASRVIQARLRCILLSTAAALRGGNLSSSNF